MAQPIQESFQEHVQFFDDLLRDGSNCRLVDEYPLVFRKDARLVVIEPKTENFLSGAFETELDQNSQSHIFVVEENGEKKAGIATLRRKIILSDDKEIDAIFIGSVVTRPEFRNQGLQRDLFTALEKGASGLGVDLLILWSNQIEFYKKLGFHLGGLQATWRSVFPTEIGNTDTNVKVTTSEVKNVEFKDAWYEQFSKKRHRVERSKEEMKLLFKTPEMKIAYTENAYALSGKGEDFKGICHEWAGPSGEVIACLNKLREQNRLLGILSPGVLHDPEERQVTRSMETSSFEPRLEYLGLFKILSDRFLIHDFDPEKLKYPFFIWGLDSI